MRGQIHETKYHWVFTETLLNLLRRCAKRNWCVFWMNLPLFRPRSVRYSRFLIWCCDEKFLYENKTANCVLRYITWSFNCLFHGVNPVARPGGRPLSEQEKRIANTPITSQHLRFQVVEIRGDWEFQKTLWNFRSSWKGTQVCYRCPALAKSLHDPGMLYWDESENSSWSSSEYDTTDFISKQLPERHICAFSTFNVHVHVFFVYIPTHPNVLNFGDFVIVACYNIRFFIWFHGCKNLMFGFLKIFMKLGELIARPPGTIGTLWTEHCEVVQYAYRKSRNFDESEWSMSEPRPICEWQVELLEEVNHRYIYSPMDLS